MSRKASSDRERSSERRTREKAPKSPLCMNVRAPCRNGWQLLTVTLNSCVAARTCASTRGLVVTRAISCRFWLLHAGETDRNNAGAGEPGTYQATPNPSPFSGSVRSFA